MKKYLLALVFAVVLSLSATQVFAQPGFDDDVSDAPVDAGISLLVAAGIGLGLKAKQSK